MHFSARTAWDREEGAYATRLHLAQQSSELLDLTVSNPTRCGFGYDAASLLMPLTHPDSLSYAPHPFGLLDAREAVAAYYRDHNAHIAPQHLCLTTSTSEAYGFLFQLLCDPGDEVLIARPSYPLFDVLAGLHDVKLREYPLFYDPGHYDPGHYDPSHHDPSHHDAGHCLGAAALAQSAWSIDLEALRASVHQRTRAIIVVHPNNPTGNYVTECDRHALLELCAERKLALVVDEVFLDYNLPGTPGRSFVQGESPALCFVLSGLSKVCALPQMKLSWIATRGPATLVDGALTRLDIIADSYLSVNAPVQHALRHWLGERRTLQDQVKERIVSNLRALDHRLQRSAASRLALEGGWTAVLRVPREIKGQEFALACLDRGVSVQPGSLYGLPPGRIVLSLLTPPGVWAAGLAVLPI